MVALARPIYDPSQSFDANLDKGPQGAFADGLMVENVGEPQASFLGFPVFTPFGIPAGPLLNAKYVRAALTAGYDVVVYKTQRSVTFPSNSFPNILYVQSESDLSLAGPHTVVGSAMPPQTLQQLGITNSFGMPSRGPQEWMPDFASIATRPGQLAIMSVVGTIQQGFSQTDYYDDFAKAAALAVEAGARVIEFNLSCPNVATEGVLCYTPDAVEAICRRVADAAGGRKLIAKIGYFVPEQQALLEDVVARMVPYVAAIAAINTVPAVVVDAAGDQALPGAGRRTSGICGAPIKSAGLSMVHRLHALRRRKGYSYEIVGVGGVMTPGDYDQYREAGADLVQSGTGAMWNPYLARQIKERPPRP